MSTVSKEIAEELILLPCPFCGGKAEFWIERGGLYWYRVKCCHCDALAGGSAFKNDEYNAKIWNTRA